MAEFFCFFAAIKLPQQPRNRTAPPNIADSTKSGVRGEKNAVTHLSFPDAEPAVKDLIPLSAEKRGEEANILPHSPPHRRQACRRITTAPRRTGRRGAGGGASPLQKENTYRVLNRS